ncbi:MAG TPA: hypothetical protein VI451_13290 [Anaerolineales bacterium]|nr:hypothetical protein [Anaerolineales bacterium]
MVTITFFFWVFVFVFAVIGAMRGWAQELLVAFSVILGLFIITVLGLVPVVRDMVGIGFVNANGNPVPIAATAFWIRAAIIIALTFFGYQSPQIASGKIKTATKRSERLQDTVLGIIVGGVNGYLSVGTLWFFLIEADYFLSFVSPPQGETLASAQQIINLLPPMLLNGNAIYFAIALAFAFVVIVLL